MAGLTADVPELQSLPGKGGPAKTLRPNLDFAGMWQISGRCLCFALRLGRSWMMTEVLRNGFVLCSYLRGEVQASGSVGCQRKDEVGKVQTLTIPGRYLAYICVFSRYQLNPGRAVPGRTSTISPMRFLPRCLRMHLAGRPARTALQRDEALPNTDDKKVCWWNVVDVLIYRYLADIW